MSSSKQWLDFVPQLQNHFPNAKIYTPDISGNGLKNSLKTPTDPLQNILSLKEQLPPLQKKRIFIGFSLGGMLSVEWAKRFPDEVLGLVLMNSSFSESPFFKRYKPKAFFKSIVASFTKDPILRERKFLHLTSNLRHSDFESISKSFYQIEKENPTQAINFVRQLILARKLSLKNKPDHAHILLLNSIKDQVVHTKCSHRISKKWNITLNLHPTAGHDLTLDDPMWVAQHIHQWITHQKFINLADSQVKIHTQQQELP